MADMVRLPRRQSRNPQDHGSPPVPHELCRVPRHQDLRVHRRQRHLPSVPVPPDTLALMLFRHSVRAVPPPYRYRTAFRFWPTPTRMTFRQMQHLTPKRPLPAEDTPIDNRFVYLRLVTAIPPLRTASQIVASVHSLLAACPARWQHRSSCQLQPALQFLLLGIPPTPVPPVEFLTAPGKPMCRA